MSRSPAEYEAWYNTARGAWIAQCEFSLMMSMMCPTAGDSLLDVGCGTGHFSRHLADAGLKVTGIDPDNAALEFARGQNGVVDYRRGDARQLPFDDSSFDYCSAITSLCFVEDAEGALAEMWRVSRKGVLLGLLNRHSLLHFQRDRHPGYTGARWDSSSDVQRWAAPLRPQPLHIMKKTAVTFPAGNLPARLMEKAIPSSLPFGAFLAVYLSKQE